MMSSQGQAHERLLYRVEQLPVFQNRVYDTPEEAVSCPRGDVCLVQDLHTGLIYNSAFRPELMRYDANYQNEQACSAEFRRHLEAVADLIGRYLGRSGLVEVGCGKGYFLEMLLARGFDITGFDPAYEGSNPRIRPHPFMPGIDISARGLILRHVLEHIPSPIQFLEQLRAANGGSGLIYIEVPCFDWICQQRAWFDIFYEHVNYFRLTDFQRMFARVVASGYLFGRQYLYVVADLASLRTPVAGHDDQVTFPDDFLSRVRVESEQGPAAVWGGRPRVSSSACCASVLVVRFNG